MARVVTAPMVTASVAERVQRYLVRFDVHQILQHIGLAVTFVLLAITGLPIKFSDWSISQWWIGVLGGLERTRSIHHFAAWAMVFVCVYHLSYISYTTFILRRPFPVKMIPTTKDFRDMIQELGYFLGVTKQRPKSDRFNWKEKFDYWAIFWGMPVMVLSGFILLYPVFVSKFLPGWIIPVALVAHSDEALLAVGWILVVHVVFNHFAPGVFPLNKSIFTGKVPEERYRRDHPLEYERLFGMHEPEERPAEEVPERVDKLSQAAEGADRLSEAAERKGRLSETGTETKEEG